jgi:hypothetical protein
MSSPDLTPAAQQLANAWARTLDYVGRCQRAIEEGNWVHLNDEAGELSVLADEVSAAAAALTRDETATSPAQLLAAIQAIGERPGE